MEEVGGEGDGEEGVSRGRMEDDGGEGWRRRMEEEKDGGEGGWRRRRKMVTNAYS